ncbi:MAG: Dabb family protein [Rhizobiaceae bacterium]
MIRHCVFLHFRPEIRHAERIAIYEAVSALKNRIPGFLDVEVGVNISPEGLDKGFSEGFIVNFDTAAARDAYLADAEHAKVGARIVAATQGGVAGVFVFDLDTTDFAKRGA